MSIYQSVFVQAWKRDKSAWFPKLTTSKNEAILRDVPQKWKVECRADSLVPMRFAIFRLHLSKLLRLPQKSDTGSYEVLHLSRKIISANLKIWCAKMQPFSGNQRPDLLTCLTHVVFLLLRLPRKMHLCRSFFQMSHACQRFWNCCKTFTFCSLLARCTVPRACHTRAHYNFRNCSEKLCFVHFGFEMCFAPLRHARFRHLNFQKWSENGVFCTFWLQNVLCATTPCTFSIAELPKVVWDPHAFTLLTWKCASCPQWRALFQHRNSQKCSGRGDFDFLTSKSASRHTRCAIFHLSSPEMAPHPPL